MATRRQASRPATGETAASSSFLAQLSALYIRPKKGLGQNICRPRPPRPIVAAAELTVDHIVLEIGPGPGVLTELIAEQAGRVIAVELDDRLIPLMRNRFANQSHVSIVHADILKVDVGELMTKDAGRRTDTGVVFLSLVVPSFVGYKVIANLPYYLTSAVIRQLLQSTPPPERLVLTVQREVAAADGRGAAGHELAGLGGAVLLLGADNGEDPGGGVLTGAEGGFSGRSVGPSPGTGSPWGDLRNV